MKYAVVYDSPTGNTKILAEEIKSCMDGQNGSTEECLYFGEPVPDEGFMEKLSEDSGQIKGTAEQNWRDFWNPSTAAESSCSAQLASGAQRSISAGSWRE